MENQSQTFEAAVERLEQIVKKMEQGEIPLDEALALFQEGTGLVRQCTRQLDEAELMVSTLTKGPDGQPVITEMDADV